jgi:3-phenylpropionate/trans-cinnamate dioxygenase ferredoxin subunit
VGKVVIGTVAEMPPGTRRQVMVGGRAIAVFNVDGQFFALRDICPHQGACLSAGTLVVGSLTASGPGDYTYERSGGSVRCPWHGWEYDLATGQSFFDPTGNRVRQYPVWVEPGDSLADADADGRIPGPFVAESVEISVEADYVVVEA